MKKIILTVLAVLLAISITACSSVNDSGDTSSITSGASRSGALKIGGFPTTEIESKGYHAYYVEAVNLEGDPGENPTALDSAKTAWKAVKQSMSDILSAYKNFYIILREMTTIDNQDCYVYMLSGGSEYETGDDYSILDDLAVNYSGTVYWLLDESGEWSAIGEAPGDNKNNTDADDTNSPNWWGTFKGDGFSIEISNFNGTGFRFNISNLRNGETVFDGTAALDPENSQMAEYAQIGFYLYDDFNAVDFLASESSEWEHLRGKYERID